MNRKSTNITILLLVVVMAIFITMGFFGIGGFTVGGSEPTSDTQLFFDELNTTGTVADLRVETVATGTGSPIAPGDTIQVHYTGTLTDGTVFDSSRSRGTPLTLVVATDGSLTTPEGGGLITGWNRGLQGITVGERRLLIIPSSQGYGAQSVGSIPANSTLIFDVELVSRTAAQ
ncbi:hypothetical protein A2841_03135 [Candidatus Kaiserbacteria bacterium RIFCSPHIGHO2_01_FULL_48_10]|uniref:Peptidyl-prolyl cis-trans isomerase n=1 Tax=Candidatus Kaiserbacteria bacterium RIFCSPHIGHO2_01_FULL_48_10 TaxID=1798476 RepID=A0A1F6C1F7_9BACT|nr:MAG: hypothetical protein A2841_03135 [Candidatus Kaiserbacteria bacterium RIFCSPHIGHO2_01_FULL_48_10]